MRDLDKNQALYYNSWVNTYIAVTNRLRQLLLTKEVQIRFMLE